MSSKLPIYVKYDEYDVCPIRGTPLFKVIKVTSHKRQGQSYGILLKVTTVLKHVTKDVAEEFVYLAENKHKINRKK